MKEENGKVFLFFCFFETGRSLIASKYQNQTQTTIMKKMLFLSFILVYGLEACKESALSPEIVIDSNESFVEGEWKLVKSRGSMVDVTVEGEDLKRIEIYTFHADGTFDKAIEDGDFNAGASGTYLMDNVSEELTDRYIGLVVLTFTDGDNIAGNCTGGDEEKEGLYISKVGQMENIGWAPCDGPWLYYEKQ